jgi:hypothetical protein
MVLWFLCTALPLNVLDHCMKWYWLPTISFQVMFRTRKMQRTAGPIDRPTDRPFDRSPDDSYIAPRTTFRVYNNSSSRTRNVSSRHGCPRMQKNIQMLHYLVSNLFAQTSFFISSSNPLKLFNVKINHFYTKFKVLKLFSVNLL